MLAEQSLSRYDCIPHTPDFYALSSIGIWGRLSMSGYSPMGKSDKFNNLAFAYSLIPSSISLGLGNKRITPKGISNRGFQVHSHLLRGWLSGGGYIAMYNLPLTTETFSESHLDNHFTCKYSNILQNFKHFCILFDFFIHLHRKGRGLADKQQEHITNT